MTVRTYSELVEIDSFIERFRYLALRGGVGEPTFGGERWMNQDFYTSREWRTLRHHIIARDECLDLAFSGFDIHTPPIIHHMNPMSREDLVHGDESILDPEFLITTCHTTHNAIHYGGENHLPRELVVRRPGDTDLW